LNAVRFHRLSSPKRNWTRHPAFPVILGCLLTLLIVTPASIKLQEHLQEGAEKTKDRRQSVKDAGLVLVNLRTETETVLKVSRTPRLISDREKVFQDWAEFTASWESRCEFYRTELREYFEDPTPTSPVALFDSICERSTLLKTAIINYSEQVTYAEGPLSKMTNEACIVIPRGGGIEASWCEAVEEWQSLQGLLDKWPKFSEGA
jgi:hypothetical protein